MTAEQQQETLATKALIIQKLGLSPDQAKWSYTERTNYLKEFAQAILRNPDKFSASQVAQAEAVNSRTYAELESYSLSDKFNDFTNELSKQAEDIVSAGGDLIQRAVIIAVVAGVLGYYAPSIIKALRD